MMNENPLCRYCGQRYAQRADLFKPDDPWCAHCLFTLDWMNKCRAKVLRASV